jgi:hypothetical protein
MSGGNSDKSEGISSHEGKRGCVQKYVAQMRLRGLAMTVVAV